jgi:hypothetical protein
MAVSGGKKPPFPNPRLLNILLTLGFVSIFLTAYLFSGLGDAVALIRRLFLSTSVFVIALFITYSLAGVKAAMAVAVLMGYIFAPLVVYEPALELPMFYACVALMPLVAYFGLRGDDFNRGMALMTNMFFLVYTVLLLASYLLGLAPPSA